MKTEHGKIRRSGYGKVTSPKAAVGTGSDSLLKSGSGENRSPVRGSSGELHCTIFILPRTGIVADDAGRTRVKMSRVMIAVAAYALVGAIVLYSVAENSLAAFMPAVLVAALYIVLSHRYDLSVKARQEIADTNLRKLLSISVSKN